MGRLFAPVAVALTMASAACTTHPGFDVIDSCTSCARGGVAGGAVVHSATIGWASRPGGGWIRVDGRDLVWADPEFRIDHDHDVDGDGELDVLAVGPDDTAYTVTNTSDDFDFFIQLAAVAPDGSVRWRLAPAIADFADVHMAATADTVFVYGVTELPISIGDTSVNGLFVAQLEARTGAIDWTWSAPGQSPTAGGPDLEVAPRADGTMVVVGTFEGGGTLDFGGATAPLTVIGNTTGFVASLDASGHGQWLRAITGPDRTGVHHASLMADGGIAVTGSFDGAPLDLGNGFVIPTGARYEDQFVGVLEPDGGTRWATALGDGIGEQFTSLATLGNTVMVAGEYADYPLSFGDDVMPERRDAFIASITGGALDWVTEAHGPEYEAATVVARAGVLDAVVQILDSTDPGPRSLDVGRVHVEGVATLFANLVP